MEEDTAEMVSAENEEKVNYENEDGTAVKTLRMALNLVINALIFVTVFVCLVYACRPKLTTFTLHIILCTLGYQFFMCQGVLAISRYNSWTVHMKKEDRYHVHWVFQLLGLTCVAAGTVLLFLELPKHFTSPHGASGLVAFISSAVSFLVGFIAIFVIKFGKSQKATTVFRIIHYITGVCTLFMSAISLCFAFEDADFKMWLSMWFNNDVIPGHVLQLMTALFTVVVAIDFLIPIRKNVVIPENVEITEDSQEN